MLSDSSPETGNSEQNNTIGKSLYSNKFTTPGDSEEQILRVLFPWGTITSRKSFCIYSYTFTGVGVRVVGDH